MRTQRKITIGLIICILIVIIGRCTAQVPLSETNAVTLKTQVLHKAQSDVDPISQRLTTIYMPVTERKTRRLKNFVRKLRRIFRPNSKA